MRATTSRAPGRTVVSNAGTEGEARPPDAIIVLGCRVGAEGLSTAARRRALGARDAFLEGVAPRVVPSGGRRWGDRVEALAMAEALEAWGVPARVIHPELSSLTTTENAAYATALIGRLVGRRPRVVVVTCSWHLGRALACFDRAGADAIGRGIDPPAPTFLQRAMRTAHEMVSSRLDRIACDRAGAELARYRGAHLAGPPDAVVARSETR